MGVKADKGLRKPRLLFIVGRFVIGGHATDNIPLLYYLKDKYTIRVIYGEKEADEIEPLFLLEQFPGIDMHKLPSLKRSVNPFADLITIVSLFKRVRSFAPDIIHTHGAKSGLTGRIAGMMYRKAVIVHTFHGLLFHSYFHPLVNRIVILLERLLSKITDAAIALSPSQKLEIVERFSVFPKEKVFEIPLGLFAPFPAESYQKVLRTNFGLQPGEVAIGIIGRLVPIKDPLEFLRIAAAIIKAGHSLIKFFIIGDGQLMNAMTRFLDQEEIPYSSPNHPSENAPFIFTSWISNVYEVLYELDVVALTSLNEGTPNSLIEAQLCAKPVVAYNVGGVKDTFLDSVSGFLVEKNNTSDFVEKLLLLATDKNLRIKMGTEGKSFSEHKYSKLTEVRLMDELYSALLKKSSATKIV